MWYHTGKPNIEYGRRLAKKEKCYIKFLTNIRILSFRKSLLQCLIALTIKTIFVINYVDI